MSEQMKWQYDCRILGTSSLKEGAMRHEALKAAIAEADETFFARQRFAKHVTAATDTHATV
jgi:hypothetical protein